MAVNATFINKINHMPIEIYRIQNLGTWELPRIIVSQPVIRVLNLPAPLYRLHKHAIFITDAIAKSRQIERRHRVKKTGCQSAKTTIAQACVLLNTPDFFHFNAYRIEFLAASIINI